MNIDWSVWQWLIGGAIGGAAGLVSGLVSKTWTARGLLKDLQHTDADHTRRLEALEAHQKKQVDKCERQKAELLEEVKQEICNIVKLAIKDLIIDHNLRLATISTDVAVQSKMMEQLQADVTAIFTRINRRSDDRDEQQGDRRR